MDSATAQLEPTNGDNSLSPLRILCVHQGYELYGSDRVFVESLKSFREAFPSAEITVLLPKPGPILDLIDRDKFKFVYGKLWVLRRRYINRILLAAPFTFISKLREARKIICEADIVYISTVVVINFIVAARHHSNAVLHVHEIPSPAVLPVFRELVRFARAKTIFNSKSSHDAYRLGDIGSTIIHNGYRPKAEPTFSDFDGSRRLRLLTIGRISPAKGQDLVIRAIAALPAELRERLELRIVGSTFEDDAFEARIAALIDKLGLEKCITLGPFTPDPVDIYQWCDLLIVPSRVTESFGLVVIEAMAYGKGVIAAARGGILETVADGETGWLFTPGDVESLAARLSEAVRKPEAVRFVGRRGYTRFVAQFDMSHAARAFAKVVALAGDSARARRIRS